VTTIDVIKAAYRQTKDGFAITFVLHPQDDHEELARAPIGSQWQIEATPLDDDGNPETDGAQPRKLPAAASVREGGGTVAPAPRPFNLANHIGMLCAADRFHVFLERNYEDRWKFLNGGTPTQKAAEIVRSLCGVKSRAEIESNPDALNKWQQVWIRYNNWQRNNPF
jgi:hypothetical protein